MKRILFGFLCFASAFSGHAADTRAASAATLELSAPKCEIRPQLFTTGWEGQSSKGGLLRDADGACPFLLEAKNTGPIRGKASYSQTADGAVEAAYTFVPERDVTLNALYVGTALPTVRWAGGTWASDTKTGILPPDNKGLFVMNETAKSLTLVSGDGKERLSFAFPAPTPVMIQDDRQWGPTFSVRIGHIGGTRIFKAGEAFTERFTLSVQETQRLIFDEPVTIQAGADWIPLKPEADILAGSALDFSRLGLTDAPAGKHGWVVSKGPHFEFESKPGAPQRFYGVNLCFSANYLEPADAARLAQRLARTGYNALRVHHHDGGLVEGSADGTTVNPGQLNRLEALFAACATNGIYLTTDLFVSRSVPWRGIGVDREGQIEMNAFKVLVPVHDGAWNNLKSFTRQWLGHVNPYTGRRNADEPALAWLSMINEGNFGNYLGEMRQIPEWQAAWVKWLTEKKQAAPQAFANVPATIPDSLWTTSRHASAFVLFLKEMEDQMIVRMKAFLRDELRCRALVTNRNAWTNHASDQIPREELYDYVDDHFYVDHPEFIERPWQLPSTCANANPVKNEAMGAQPVVFTRLLNKPFTITEYNYSGPGRFRGIGGILTGTMGALQDWSGIWRFTFSHDRNNVLRPEGYAMNYFDMAADPLSLAAERASLCLFLRGDLAPLARSYAMVIPKREALQMRDDLPMNHTSWPWLGWYAKLGTCVADAAPAGSTWSGRFPDVYTVPSDAIRRLLSHDGASNPPPAGDGAVLIDPTLGTLVIKTPKTSGGFAEQGIQDAGALLFDVGDTAATVWVSSLDDQPIRSSSRLLLTHLTDVQNSGIRYAQHSRKTLLNWGTLPHLVRNGKAEIRLAVNPAKDYKVYALSTGGRRVAEVPSHTVKGRLAFTAAVGLHPGSATLLYEIAKE